MPNPLTLAAATPTATDKPATSQKGPGQKAGSESFEDILGQEDLPGGTPDDAVPADASEALNFAVEAEAVTPPEPATTTIPPPTAGQASERETPIASTEPPYKDGTISTPSLLATANLQTFETPEQPQILPPSGLVPQRNSTFPASSHSLDESVQGTASHPVQLTHQAENGRVFDQFIKQSRRVTGTGSTLVPTDTERALPPEAGASASKTLAPDLVRSAAQLQLMATTVEAEPAAPIQEVEAMHAAKDEPVPQTSREPASQLSAPSTAARAEVARAIAGQLAATIQARTGSGAMEVTLNHEELGRVSIVLNGREDGLHMSIATERPEILDLMRRHLSVLTEEFQKSGYGGLSFDLGSSWGSGTHEQDTNSAETDVASRSVSAQGEQVAQTSPTPQILASGRGIDMRF
ncbi:flagellar hook-length control protein FliK [uncultured Ruegeria sp.]|uniref:flagellar hook-length control protein FliK n=1 Tax=uncultured Ruegeria sp. TaxID=259304 RepID=UPI0026287218|nr:flagellar hook-length control protein FliK [uncultured Ruegeria sp.]